MFPLLMFVNSVLAQLDISIESIQPVLELLPKSLQQLITSYLAQLSNSPSFSPMLIGIVPVSYTHLDVYKRQGHGRARQAGLLAGRRQNTVWI